MNENDTTKKYTECKYGGPLGRPGASCVEARLVRPASEAGFSLCFDRHEWLLHVRSQKTIFLELLFEVDRLPR